jgi:DNA-binding transcriptional MocR family regulator
MVRISEFAVERVSKPNPQYTLKPTTLNLKKWMDLYENDAKHNLAETCCASISLNDLLSFSQKKDLVDYSQKQVYGAIRGSEALRANIANLYSQSVSAEGVLVTNGAIQANFLALYTNIGPGDHVICQYPTYQQLYSVPESLGAEVSLWRSNEEKGWGLDLEELKTLIRRNTKLIILKYVFFCLVLMLGF